MTDEIDARAEREARRERLANEAMDRIERSQQWLDWMYVADRLGDGRQEAMNAAGVNQIQHPKYRREFAAWLKRYPRWNKIDLATRSHLFWCLDYRSEIEAWRVTLGDNQRKMLNHPTSMKRAYERAHKVPDPETAKAPKPREVAHNEEVAKLKSDIAMRDREIEFIKNAPRKDDGSLFDLHNDSAAAIADVIFGHVGLARTRGLRDALAKKVQAAEAQLRKKPKQAG
jgi:hypothetical protein